MWILARAKSRVKLLDNTVKLMRSAPDVGAVCNAAEWPSQAGARPGSGTWLFSIPDAERLELWSQISFNSEKQVILLSYQ